MSHVPLTAPSRPNTAYGPSDPSTIQSVIFSPFLNQPIVAFPSLARSALSLEHIQFAGSEVERGRYESYLTATLIIPSSRCVPFGGGWGY